MLVRHLVRQTLNNAVVNPSYSRSFRQAAVLNKKDQLPSRPTLPDHELRHVYLKGSGPGGQKIVGETISGHDTRWTAMSNTRCAE